MNCTFNRLRNKKTECKKCIEIQSCIKNIEIIHLAVFLSLLNMHRQVLKVVDGCSWRGSRSSS